MRSVGAVVAVGAVRAGGAGAVPADVVVVLSERGAAEPDAVHVEPLVAAAVALHPVHLLACTVTVHF